MNTVIIDPKAFSLFLQSPQEQWIQYWKSILCKHAACRGKVKPRVCYMRVLQYTAFCTWQRRMELWCVWLVTDSDSLLCFWCQETDFQVSNYPSIWSRKGKRFCLLPCSIRNMQPVDKAVYRKNLHLPFELWILISYSSFTYMKIPTARHLSKEKL